MNTDLYEVSSKMHEVPSDVYKVDGEGMDRMHIHVQVSSRKAGLLRGAKQHGNLQ